jgi:hypothetical protein
MSRSSADITSMDFLTKETVCASGDAPDNAFAKLCEDFGKPLIRRETGTRTERNLQGGRLRPPANISRSVPWQSFRQIDERRSQ